MDHDFDMGNDLKDDIVPLALEYYLGVIEKDDLDSEEEEEELSDLEQTPTKTPGTKKSNKDGGEKTKK